MSGIIADGVIALDLIGFGEQTPEAYRIVQWPKKVTITGVCFTINGEAAGSEEDARVWQCYGVKGRVSRPLVEGDPVDYGYEDIVPFFGDNEKPTITTVDAKYISTIGTPVEIASWYTNYLPEYIGNVAQMDPDEYLTIWIEGIDGDFIGLNQADTYGVISISYTGAATAE